MSTTDCGHIQNLDDKQVDILKNFWKLLYDNVLDAKENEEKSIYKEELFLAIGYDNPDSVLLRWLRARKWNSCDAYQQLINTIQWRYQRNIRRILARGERDLSIDELRTGKSYFMGYDRCGRPINYVFAKEHVKDQFPAESTENITIFLMETARKLIKPPHESVTVVFDLKDFGLQNLDYQQIKFLINLLENHYPESFSIGLIVNASWMFHSCWYLIKRWLDPVVQNKIHFISDINQLSQFIDLDQLPRRLNGRKNDFHYLEPTQDDILLLDTLTNDRQGRTEAKLKHAQAIDNFIQITCQWFEHDQSNDVTAQRELAAVQLRDSFEQFVPYIHTKTHYHRNGSVHEPLFDTVYQKALHRQQQQ